MATNSSKLGEFSLGFAELGAEGSTPLTILFTDDFDNYSFTFLFDNADAAVIAHVFADDFNNLSDTFLTSLAGFLEKTFASDFNNIADTFLAELEKQYIVTEDFNNLKVKFINSLELKYTITEDLNTLVDVFIIGLLGQHDYIFTDDFANLAVEFLRDNPGSGIMGENFDNLRDEISILMDCLVVVGEDFNNISDTFLVQLLHDIPSKTFADSFNNMNDTFLYTLRTRDGAVLRSSYTDYIRRYLNDPKES